MCLRQIRFGRPGRYRMPGDGRRILDGFWGILPKPPKDIEFQVGEVDFGEGRDWIEGWKYS
eukprot:957656-Amorphochlora_amoeboformis.AAC.1